MHTSDWHLGRSLEGRSRTDEQREFVDELCGIVEDERVDIVLIAGDVFDTYNPPAEAEELFFEAVERLAGGGRRAVVAIAGNHDSPDRLCAASPLATKRGVYLVGKPGDIAVAGMAMVPADAVSTGSASSDVAIAVKAGAHGTLDKKKNAAVIAAGPGRLELAVPGREHHAVVALLPYPSEARLNELLEADIGDEKQLQAAYSARVARAFAEAAKSFREDTVNLAVSHLFVIGGRESDSERQIQLGGALSVEPGALPAQAHYVALGHLHRPQAVTGAPVPCRYSGSPLSYSFSEADQQKEVVLVEATPGSMTLVTPIKLSSGRPLKQWKAKSLDEFYGWCADGKNLAAWVDLEVQVSAPLTPAQLAEMRERHPGLVNVRVVLPEQVATAGGDARLSELSLAERFKLFVARQEGAGPDQELVDLFLELAAEVAETAEPAETAETDGDLLAAATPTAPPKAGDSVA